MHYATKFNEALQAKLLEQLKGKFLMLSDFRLFMTFLSLLLYFFGEFKPRERGGEQTDGGLLGQMQPAPNSVCSCSNNVTDMKMRMHKLTISIFA